MLHPAPQRLDFSFTWVSWGFDSVVVIVVTVVLFLVLQLYIFVFVD